MSVTLALPSRIVAKVNDALKTTTSAEAGLRNAFVAVKSEKPRGMDLDTFKRAVNKLFQPFDREDDRAKYDVRKQQLSRAWRLVLGVKAPKARTLTMRKRSAAATLAGFSATQQAEIVKLANKIRRDA